LGTRPSLGPSARACPSSRSLHGVKKPREGGASGNASTARNPAQAGETDGGATSTGRARLATRSPPSSGGSAWPGETEEGCGLRPARKMQLRVVLVRRNAVAEVVGRCLTSNKPAVRTLKRVADASERGSSAESESAHMRRRRSRVKKHRESVRGGHRLRVRPGPRVVWQAPFRGGFIFAFSPRWACPGAGAVMATGSYEGFLTVEDISDHHERQLFTERSGVWS